MSDANDIEGCAAYSCLYVQGAVTARMPLRHALKNKVDEIEIGHVVSVVGHDIVIDPQSADEGYCLEKRNGRRFGKPKMIQKAEIFESATPSASGLNVLCVASQNLGSLKFRIV